MRLAAGRRRICAHRANGHFDADQASQVQTAAEEVAARGAALADKAGFRSQSMAVQAAPTWKGIVETAEQHKVSLIVLGSHRRRGLEKYLLGSVAAAVVAHSEASVLVVSPAVVLRQDRGAGHRGARRSSAAKPRGYGPSNSLHKVVI